LKERRQKPPRRASDELIRETVQFHRKVLDLLQGKEGDFGEILYRIQQLCAQLGRREEDQRLGEAFSETVEGVARRLVEIGAIEQIPRRVKLIKLTGKKEEEIPVGVERLGWEMKRPKLGESYCLYKDTGGVFRTSPVEECDEETLRTGNSVYRIEVLEETLPDTDLA
jgi:hypothetical protein